MTQDRASIIWPIMKAYAEGKQVQTKLAGEPKDKWQDIYLAEFNSENLEYRIKPESSYRSWTPKEYPIGAIYRSLDHTIHGIIQRKGDNLYITNHVFEAEEILKSQGSCSEDGGKTYSPCGILVE